MRTSQLRRILRKGRKFNCNKCPIPLRTCNAIAKGLWGEDKCLLRVVLTEILVFHTKDKGKLRDFSKPLPSPYPIPNPEVRGD